MYPQLRNSTKGNVAFEISSKKLSYMSGETLSPLDPLKFSVSFPMTYSRCGGGGREDGVGDDGEEVFV